jgi:hypothetical protein
LEKKSISSAEKFFFDHHPKLSKGQTDGRVESEQPQRDLRFLEAEAALELRMDVFLMIRRHKTTIFLDAKENTTVMELKRMIEGITKKSPTDHRLYNKDDVVS